MIIITYIANIEVKVMIRTTVFFYGFLERKTIG